jgi:hypothetical protein
MSLLPTVGRVAAFTGHMVDAPNRPTSRFPQGKVEAVRQAVAGQLRKHKTLYGFSSAARGSDLLFLEELAKLGGRAQVFLPFPREAFKRTSVGYGWDERFDQAISTHDVVELSPDVPRADKHPESYAQCNRKIFEAAQAKAKLLHQEPILITVWDGGSGDGTGGTAEAVRDWQKEGHEVVIIDISKL